MTTEQKQEQQVEIMRCMKEALSSGTDEDIARVFLSTKPKIVCYDLKEHECYLFEKDSCLYKQISLEELSLMLKNNVVKRIDEARKQMFNKMKDQMEDDDGVENTQKKLRPYDKLKNKLKTYQASLGVAKSFCELVYDKAFLDKLDQDTDTVNYLNGKINLKTGDFLPRTESDYVTLCLNYEYSAKINEVMNKKVRLYLKHICNDDEKMIEMNLKWFAYCLTGQTK